MKTTTGEIFNWFPIILGRTKFKNITKARIPTTSAMVKIHPSQPGTARFAI